MRMVQINLYFQLTYKLLNDLLFFQQLFLDHFHCTNKPCCFFSTFRWINTSQEKLCHTFPLLIILSFQNRLLLFFYSSLFFRKNCSNQSLSYHLLLWMDWRIGGNFFDCNSFIFRICPMLGTEIFTFQEFDSFWIYENLLLSLFTFPL